LLFAFAIQYGGNHKDDEDPNNPYGPSPYYIELWFDKEKSEGGVYILTSYRTTDPERYGQFVDLRSPQVWAPVVHCKQMLPFQLSRTETSMLGRWLSAEEITTVKEDWKF
jgi:hypothetical protein